MRTYICNGCGVENRAVNNLVGIPHTHTGGKPSGCQGHYVLAEEPAEES